MVPSRFDYGCDRWRRGLERSAERERQFRIIKNTEFIIIMQNSIKVQQNFSQLCSKNNLPPMNLEVQPKDYEKQPALEGEKGNVQSKKNYKWTLEEHAKYIYFLQMNKQKVKSKLVRKSNAFFKQMEQYIKTKTCIQCRSHHQKFEEKYKFPHRIITGQKKHIPTQTYSAIAEETLNSHYNNNIIHPPQNVLGEFRVKQQPKITIQVSCQTQISDLRLQYVLKTSENQQQKVLSQLYYPYLQTYQLYRNPYPFIY